MSTMKEIEPFCVFRGHLHQVTCLDSSQDKPISSLVGDHVLVSGSDDRSVRLWDIRSGKPFKAIKGFPKTISSIAIPEYDQPGYNLYVASGNEIKSFDFRNSDVVLDSQLPNVPCFETGEEDTNQIKFSSQGNALLSTNDDGGLYYKEFSSQNTENRIIGSHTSISLPITVNPVNKQVATGGMDHHIKTWNIETSTLVNDFDMNDQKFLPTDSSVCGINPRFVLSLDFNSTGNILSAGLGDGSVKLLNLSPPKKSRKTPWKSLDLPDSHRHYISKVIFLKGPQGEKLVSGAADGEFRCWEMPQAFGLKVPNIASPKKFQAKPFCKINDFISMAEDNLVIAGVSKGLTWGGSFGLYKFN